MSKNKNIAAKQIALQSSLFIALLSVLISLGVVATLKRGIRIRQNDSLQKAISNIEKVVKDRINKAGDFEFSSLREERQLQRQIIIPYYFNYIVFNQNTNKVVFSNIPFTAERPSSFYPKLPDTKGSAKFLRIDNFYGDRDLNILYLTKKVFDYHIQLTINLDLDYSQQILLYLPRALLFTLIPILLASFLIAFIIAKKTLKPVRTITETAKIISSDSLDSRLSVSKKNDEFDQLAEAFNKLFEKLNKDFQNERSFTGNVSHELKTPIAVISGQAKLLNRWGKNDPEQLEKSLKVIELESRRMGDIVENLLLLLRLGNGQIKADFQKLKILNILTTLAETTWHYAPETEFDFSEVSENAEFLTDRNLFFQLLTILTNNSVKYGKSPIKVKFDGEKLFFKDCGKGFPQESLPRIFERFYTVDPSHNKKTSGIGLGLPIAKEIATVINCSIEARNNDGAEFVICKVNGE